MSTANVVTNAPNAKVLGTKINALADIIKSSSEAEEVDH